MSDIKSVEQLALLPDRLELAEFSPLELEQILASETNPGQARDNFNWVGAYLVEQVGLFESEVGEWFKSRAKRLGGYRPIDVWSRLSDGFEAVFNYAQSYKLSVDEALAEEGIEPADENPITRSHDIAQVALRTILNGFHAAGVDLQPESADYTTSHAIHNPDSPTAPSLRWKGNGRMEDYRVHLKDGPRESMYYIVRHLSPDSAPVVLQSGIVESFQGERQDSSSDSDINGRAPSAGEVAAFVIPVASETKNGALQPYRVL